MYFRGITVALSQLWNALWAGSPDETICARAWRGSQAGHRGWSLFVTLVNGLFFWQSNHCRGAYAAEVARAHMPSAYRSGIGDK